jgi:CRISPR-associated protein Cas1
MKSLLLSGYNIHLQMKDDKLIVMDGKGLNKEPTEMIFRLNMMSYDNIIIYGNSGNVDLSAIQWLMNHDISINIMNPDGTFLTSMNPPQLKFGHVKIAQYKAQQNQRLEIGRWFTKTRFIGIETVLNWLKQRHPEIEPITARIDFEKVYRDLENAKNDKEILTTERDLTDLYWLAMKEVLSNKVEIKEIGSNGNGPTNDLVGPLRTIFNYGHAILESICLRAVNGANLDPYIGFITRMRVSRSPLVEDIEGLYQWLADKTIIECIENGTIRRTDLNKNEQGKYEMTYDGLKRLIDAFDGTFNGSVKYKGRNHQWYVMIQIKLQEFSQYLMNNIKEFDLETPEPYIESFDNMELREKIMNLQYSDWMDKGYSKNSLAYLKTLAKSNKPFKLKKDSMEKIESLTNTS